MKTKKISRENETANGVNTVLPPVIYCTCKKVESYRDNGWRLICGTCDKPFDKNRSDEVARSIASYYGW